MPFKDYFSAQAEIYAAFRPDYPKSMFDFLAQLVKQHELAWDCATGNGQAAVSLSEYFNKVIATDLSEAQLHSAIRRKNIQYKKMPAEETDFANESIDLITVAQALHWFDIEKFYLEVNRVLKPSGILAVWCYGLLQIDPKVDEIINNFYYNITDLYWPKERKSIDNGYKSLPFPYTQQITPQYTIEKNADLDYLLGYLMSWSGVQQYIKQRGKNPLKEIKQSLYQAWGNEKNQKKLQWPIYLLVGEKP